MFYEAEDFFVLFVLRFSTYLGKGDILMCGETSDLYKVGLFGALKLAMLTLVLQFLLMQHLL